MFQKKCADRIKRHVVYYIMVFFPPENRDVYEIMWKNLVEKGRPQMTK